MPVVVILNVVGISESTEVPTELSELCFESELEPEELDNYNKEQWRTSAGLFEEMPKYVRDFKELLVIIESNLSP
ncbi:hypothetical protein K435DRAFT_206907 [Dendrothele bispora CBS 962.96]|uniref:Uncharacterized protein n=1 Tax=Dendrothele bispora (strain CBS 962.96) TaxID=1314807 RepID=A0A4S8LTH7_DENBC|nr:hypothetical protein K435DRAFT_206907 [Dendrothele bispora CBS 962.96]